MIQQRQEKYELLNSVEEMLSPDTLSRILKRKVARVTCSLSSVFSGLSGSVLYEVMADDQRLVMKRLSFARDWIAIVSDDRQCRSVRLWQTGLLDRLSPFMDHAILAACREADDFALLMKDVSRGLFSNGYIVDLPTVNTLLDRLAALHAMFWEDDSLRDLALGLCTVPQMVTGCWPEHLDQYRHDRTVVEYLTKGWAALFDLSEPDVRDTLQGLMAHPQPVWDALARYPSTLVHGDYRLGNLAVLPDTGHVVALDWQWSGYAPAIICLSWFVMAGDIRPMQTAAAEYYRDQLAARLGDRFDPTWWQSMYDIGCLVDVLRKGCWHAYFATYNDDEAFRADMRRSVDSYNAIVRTGAKWL